MPGDNKKVYNDDYEVLTYVWAKLRWQLGLAKGGQVEEGGE